MEANPNKVYMTKIVVILYFVKVEKGLAIFVFQVGELISKKSRNG